MDNKEAFKQKLNSKLEEFKADFDKVKARAKGAYAEGQLEKGREKQEEELENSIKEARLQLAKLEASGEDKWEELKSEIEDHWEDLKARLARLEKQ